METNGTQANFQSKIDEIEMNISSNKKFAASVVDLLNDYKLLTQDVIDWLISNNYIATYDEALRQYQASGPKHSAFYVNSPKVRRLKYEDTEYVTV